MTRDEELAAINEWVTTHGVHRVTPVEIGDYQTHKSRYYQTLATGRTNGNRRGKRKLLETARRKKAEPQSQSGSM